MTIYPDPDPKSPTAIRQGGLVAIPIPKHSKYGRYYRVPVRVRVNDSRLCATLKTRYAWVIAKSAIEAANWMQDQLAFLPEVEIAAWGPKGGQVDRFIGWHSAIVNHMIGQRMTDAQKKAKLEEILFDKDQTPVPDEVF